MPDVLVDLVRGHHQDPIPDQDHTLDPGHGPVAVQGLALAPDPSPNLTHGLAHDLHPGTSEKRSLIQNLGQNPDPGHVLARDLSPRRSPSQGLVLAAAAGQLTEINLIADQDRILQMGRLKRIRIGS